MKHTHFSALNLLGAFLAVIVVGTVWRLGSMRLMASNRTGLQHFGAAMRIQY